MYNNRNEFINDNISEKITLCHLNASTRLFDFENPSLNVYKRSTNYIVTNVKNFTKTTSINVGLGEWYYDVSNKNLYVGSNDISSDKIIVTYTLYFSDAPVITTWDLQDESTEVEYQARLLSSPSFKSNIGVDQKAISLTNSGSIELENNDGYFDEIYDFLIFENKRVEIYSYSRSLKPSDSKILFRGNIYDRSYSSDKVTFQAKDSYTRLEESISLSKFTESDNVVASDLNNYKRLVYGKVDGHVCKSIDKISSGYPISGTISTNISSDIVVTGTSTSFLSQTEDGTGGTPILLNVNDTIIVDDAEFTIKSIDSETQLTLNNNNEVSIYALRDSAEKLYLDTKTGSISTSGLNANEIIGVGTLFTTELQSGDVILVQGTYLEVDVIIDDNTLTLTTNYPFSFSSSSYSLKSTISIDGEVSFTPPNRLLIGTSTDFLNECSPDDTLTIGDNTYKISKVLDSNNILVDENSVLDFDLINLTASNKSDKGVPFKNRVYNCSGHYLKESYYTLISQPQFNRVVLSDATGLRDGDYLEFIQSGNLVERAQIRRVSFNTLTFEQNLDNVYDNTVTIFKNPIEDVFIDGSIINKEDLQSITNTSTGCSFTLTDQAELNIAESFDLPSSSFLFKSGKREIDILGSNSNVQNEISTRDFIKAYGDSDSLYIEVLSVDEDKIYLRSEYQGTSGVKKLSYKKVNVINDSTKVSCNLVGKPKNNIATNELIQYGPDIAKDLISQTELVEFINESSFVNASNNSKYTLGIAIPTQESDTTTPTIKTVIDRINQTIYGSMSIDTNLQINYNILDTQRPENKDLRVIGLDDQIRWSVKSKGNSIYSFVNSTYRNKESDSSNLKLSADNETAIDFETSNKTNNIELLSYYENESQELTERNSFINSLSNAQIEITSDLRLSDLSMGEKVILDIPRLYKRLGDSGTRLKIATIIGIEVSGDTTKLQLSDLGNLYNRSSVITNDDSHEFSLANEVDKTYDSYITDDNGIIDNNEDIQYINLIF